MARKSKKAELEEETASALRKAVEKISIGVPVDAVDVPTADVVTVVDPSELALGLRGAFVKLAPRLSAEERAGFDASAARRSCLEAGARAVVVAPTFAAAERGASPERGPGPADARAELRAWFSSAGDGGDAAAALEACLRIADEVGL